MTEPLPRTDAEKSTHVGKHCLGPSYTQFSKTAFARLTAPIGRRAPSRKKKKYRRNLCSGKGAMQGSSVLTSSTRTHARPKPGLLTSASRSARVSRKSWKKLPQNSSRTSRHSCGSQPTLLFPKWGRNQCRDPYYNLNPTIGIRYTY